MEQFIQDLRASDFESKEEMANFLDEEGPSGADKFVDKLWGKGVNNLTQVGNKSIEAVQSLLDDRSPEIDDLLDFASTHSGMRSLKDILNRRLPRPNMSIVRSSTSQTDKDRGSHPVSVERWTDFPSVLQKHQQELPDTKNRFICSVFHRMPRSAREASVEHNWLAIGDFLSAAIRYRANLGLVRWKASWQSQGSHTQTVSDARHAPSTEGSGADSRSQWGLRKRGAAVEAQSAAATDANRSSYDLWLKLPAGEGQGEGEHGRGRGILELKRIERLCSSLDSAWEEQREVDLVDIWNNPDLYPQSLSQNAKGLLAQINHYSAGIGTRYSMASNYLWTWGIHMDGNHMRVSQPFRFDSEDPTVLMVADCITTLMLSDEGIGDMWDTALPPMPPSAAGGGGQPPRRSLRLAQRQPHPGRRDERDSGAPKGRDGGGGDGSGQGVAGASTSAATMEDSPRSEESSFSALHPSPVSRARAEEAAAAFHLRQISGFAGHGALGNVYLASLPGGSLVALKIAQKNTRKAEALEAEMDAYMVLEELWGTAVPRLILGGEMKAHGHGIVLGTEFLEGRTLRTGDGGLYQAAAASLCEVHRRGIVHNDIHASNFLVIDGGQAPPRVVILDFACALFTRDEALANSEMQKLWQLFGRLG